MTKADSSARIKELKRALGSTVVIAAHHYQNPDIIDLADLSGDSYRLSLDASRTGARHIVFCGVRFMAESALVLAREGQSVWMPNFHAGCPMADMVSEKSARPVLDALEAALGEEVIPLTYMNSNVDMKALTGEKGGAILTSGNAHTVATHVLSRGKRVLFSPDGNLGANVAREAGLSGDEVLCLSRPVRAKDGSRQVELPAPERLKAARFFLWDGFCPIHQRMTLADVERARAAYPGAEIHVHPECTPEVVLACDGSGSTDRLLNVAKAAAEQKDRQTRRLVLGTEATFVQRIARDLAHTGLEVFPLRDEFCVNMARTDLDKLLATLEAIAALEPGAPAASGQPTLSATSHAAGSATEPANGPTRVSVEPALAANAHLALTRMIEITEAPK